MKYIENGAQQYWFYVSKVFKINNAYTYNEGYKRICIGKVAKNTKMILFISGNGLASNPILKEHNPKHC